MLTIEISITGLGILVFLVIMGVAIKLQFLLSKKKSMILGLILPAIIFGFYLMFLLSVVVLSTDILAGQGFKEWIMFLLILLGQTTYIITPAVILLIIYFVSRRKMRRNRRLRKMVIEDWT